MATAIAYEPLTRRDIETYSDKDLAEEMNRRGLAKVVSVQTILSAEAVNSDAEGFTEYAERQMGDDIGWFLRDSSAVKSTRTPQKDGGAVLRMEVTVLLTERI